MAESIKSSYDFTIPQGEYQSEKILWETGSEGTLTITPSDTYALYVARLKILVSDNFTFGALDEINITINAYNNVPAREIVAASVEEIIALGDPRFYLTNVFPSWGKTHMVSLLFTPPIYLKSSTSPTESVVLSYVESGGISAGHCLVTADIWNVLEAFSGLS